MLQVDSVISEENLRLALDAVAEENEELRSSIVFRHTRVIQQVITNRKIPVIAVNACNLDDKDLQVAWNVFNNPARIISVLEEKYTGDESIYDWREILDEILTGDLPRKARTAGTSKLNAFARPRNTVPPETCIYSANTGPRMTFVHTSNTSSGAYYRLADRIRDKISFSVDEVQYLFILDSHAITIWPLICRHSSLVR